MDCKGLLHVIYDFIKKKNVENFFLKSRIRKDKGCLTASVSGACDT